MPSADKFEAPQGNPLFEVQLRAITESLAGNGIVGGGDFEVTATGNNLEIEVASGTMFYVGSEYDLGAAETHTLTGGDADFDRWDTVYFDTATGSSGVREGTPEQYPEAPDIQGDEMFLAAVYVEQGATDVPGNRVLNWRAMFSNEAEQVHYNDDPDVYPDNDVEAALDELQEAAQITAYPLDIATDTEASAYPMANSDLANSTIDVNADTGLTTTNAPIGLGGNATLAVDQAFAPTWTGQHAFDLHLALQEQGSTPSTPSSGYAQVYPKDDGFVYSQDDAGRERRVGGDVKTATVSANYSTDYEDVLFVDPSGTGGLTITLASADARDGHGLTIIDVGNSAEDNVITVETEGSETIDGGSSKEIATNSAQLLLESDGSGWFTSGGAAAIGINDEEFATDESGAVADANSGVAYVTQVEDTRTLAVYQAGLILADGQPAPTDLDLVIATLDGSGGATKQTDIIVGDGTVQADEKGDPLATYENTSGGEQTVAILVDNGNFNAGTGSSQDIFATAHGAVEV